MTEYGIQNAYIRKGIDVGRLSKDRTTFIDKTDATDMALAAVAQYAREHFGGGLIVTFPGLDMEVEVHTRPLATPAESAAGDEGATS